MKTGQKQKFTKQSRIQDSCSATVRALEVVGVKAWAREATPGGGGCCTDHVRHSTRWALIDSTAAAALPPAKPGGELGPGLTGSQPCKFVARAIRSSC